MRSSPAEAAQPGNRRAELADRLSAVEQRIAAACARAGRRRDDVVLIAVTKTFPASDVELLYELGIREVGENRDQEATAKRDALVENGFDPDQLAWHFVGHLQTNKCGSVAHYARMVHSVDRPRLVHALDAAAATAERVIDCLVQVDLDPAPKPGRSGVPPSQVPALAEAVASSSGLRFRGLMTVAPLGADPGPVFSGLRALAAGLASTHPDATVVSAGMSGDFEAAVAVGATHLRVGAALLGSRRYPG